MTGISERPKRIRNTITCTECGVQQTNIWRHMINVHHKKVKKEPAKWITSKGYVVKICPANRKDGQPCGKIIKRMRDHLKRTHRMSDKVQIRNMLGKAEPIYIEDGGAMETSIETSAATKETNEQFLLPSIEERPGNQDETEMQACQETEMPDFLITQARPNSDETKVREETPETHVNESANGWFARARHGVYTTTVQLFKSVTSSI